MDELERHLRDLAGHRAEQVPEFDPTSLTVPDADDRDGRGPGRTSPVILVAAAVALALAVGGGWLLLRDDGTHDHPSVAAAPSTGAATTGPAATTQVTSSPSTTIPDVIAPSPTVPRSCPISDNDALPQSGSGNSLPPPLAQLDDVTVATGACASNIVFTFGAVRPDWSVGYETGPFHEEASGRPVDVAGNAFLVVRFEHASAFTIPASPEVDSPIVREIRKTQDFEGVVTWVIGLDTQRPFGVSVDSSGHITIQLQV